MARPERRDFTDAFIVLLKRDVPDLPALRGHVDDVANGSRHYFTSIDGLVAFFRGIAGRPEQAPSHDE